MKSAFTPRAMALALLLLPMRSHGAGLDQLIRSVLASHPALHGQLAQSRAAQAGVESARAQFYPTPSYVLESRQSGTEERTGTLSLQQPLWTGGRLTADLDAARAGTVASEAAVRETGQQLAMRVVQVYGEWLSAHLRTAAASSSETSHIRLRELVERRTRQGAAATSDLTLALARQHAVTADLALARSQEDMARARLSQLLGHEIDSSTLTGAIALPLPLASDRQAALAMALAASPALEKARAQAEEHEAGIAARRAAYQPEVYLRLERQFGAQAETGARPGNRVSIGLKSNFGAGLSSMANVAGARARHEAALAEIDTQRRAVTEQLVTDHALAQSIAHRHAALAASLEATVEVADSYDRQFLAGKRTWLDVMNAARELAQTKMQLAELQAAQVVVTWRLAVQTRPLSQLQTVP